MNNNIKSILIIGLGLIGGSIAKAAKEKGITVFGFDIDSNIVDVALEKNIIDFKISNFDEVTESKMDSSVDLIIISVTPIKTLEVINSIKELWNTKITITETSSVENSGILPKYPQRVAALQFECHHYSPQKNVRDSGLVVRGLGPIRASYKFVHNVNKVPPEEVLMVQESVFRLHALWVLH